MRLVIAEDSVLLREGLSRIVADNGMTVVAQVSDAHALRAAVDEHQPDAVLTDIKMPPGFRTEGLEAAADIKSRFPRIGVLVLSQYVEADYAMKVMNSGGGVGYLLKERLGKVDELLDAIRRVGVGGNVIDPEVVDALISQEQAKSHFAEMTPREKEILGLMAQGWSNTALSDRLHVSPKTVETHIGRIFNKLGLHPAPEGHRRVLAVLAYLSSTAART
ncbi:MAG: response regulator transcription factor [Actinomycetota bacterium]|nr:response regulator transcription factor [Actinomycetota bacterium]